MITYFLTVLTNIEFLCIQQVYFSFYLCVFCVLELSKKNYLCIRYVSVVYVVFVVSVVCVHPITCREGAEGGVEV